MSLPDDIQTSMIAPLSKEELRCVLLTLDAVKPIAITRIRYQNRQEIRRIEFVSSSDLLALVLAAQEDGHQYGGDMEIPLDANRILVGHHDGIYWIEEAQSKTKPNDAA